MWLFFGKIVDPTKIFISICAGVAKTPLRVFIPLAFVGSVIWAFIWTYLGYLFGKNFENIWLAFLLLFIGFVVIAIFMKQFNKTLGVKK